MVALRLGFKLFVHGFGFYPSAFLYLEIVVVKVDNSCNSTHCPLQQISHDMLQYWWQIPVTKKSRWSENENGSSTRNAAISSPPMWNITQAMFGQMDCRLLKKIGFTGVSKDW
jgi:hypothetical protein